MNGWGGATYLLLLLALGYLPVLLVDARRRLPLAELAGLLLTLGAGLLGLLVFLVSLAGWAPSRATAAVELLVVAAAVLLAGWRRGWVGPIRGGAAPAADAACCCGGWLARWAWVPLAVVAAAPLLVTSIDALGMPLYEWDATAIWYFKAVVVAHDPLRQAAYFHDISFSYSHLDYPLLLPCLIGGLHAALGQDQIDGARVLLPLLYAGLGLVVYAGLRPQLSRLAALTLAAVLLWTPMLWHWSGGGTADTPLAVFLAGLSGYAGRWLTSRRTHDLLYAALFATAAAQTKQEGLVVAGGALAAVALVALWHARGGRAPGTWRPLATAIVLTLLLTLPWLLWRHGLPKTHENYGGRLTVSVLATGLDRLPAIARDFYDRMTDATNFGLLWVLLPLSALAGWRAWRLPAQQAWWLLLAGQLGAYTLAFMVTPWELQYQLNSAAGRVLGQACPLVLWLIGGHWAALRAAPVTKNIT